MLLYAELEQRKAAGGPRLNELTPSERSEVVREVLTQYVTPIDNPPQQLAEHRLREMLRVDQYAHDAEHHTWRDFSDPRTDRYIDGEVGYDAPDYPFVPTGMDRKARMEELRTPLPELAARWAEERRERPRTIEDWEARYYPEDGRPRQGPSPAVRVKVDAYERAYGYTPACVTFALEAIERHRERETAAARRGREEGQPEAWVPRGTAPGNADRLAGMDEATTGGRKPQDGFRVSYGAPPDVKAGWYLEKLDAAGATERIQGPGSVARIREELRSELGPGREDAVGRVLENGLDEHVREACRKFLEQSSPEHRAGLAEATARTGEARTALAASEREIVTLDVRDPYTILEWQPPDGVEMNHQKEGRGRHEVRFHTTRPVDIVVKVADKAVDELHVGLITSQPGSIRLDSDEKGNAVRRGDGAGDAVREGQGHGNAWHDGSGAGNAVRDGAGDGAAIRSGTGDGDARRTGRGNGDADRQGRGKGDAVVDSRGKGDAHVHEHAVGDATRDGRGAGNATVSGHATGNAARTGSGDGDATVRDHARGTATVSGSCPGNATNSSEEPGDAVNRSSDRGEARREGGGDGHAVRSGEGAGAALRAGNGDGHAWRAGSGNGAAVNETEGHGDAVRTGDGEGVTRRRFGKGEEIGRDLGDASPATRNELGRLERRHAVGDRDVQQIVAAYEPDEDRRAVDRPARHQPTQPAAAPPPAAAAARAAATAQERAAR